MTHVNLAPYNVIVVLFIMPECSACEEYTPRFLAKATRRRGFDIFDPKSPTSPRRVPILIYDVANPDPGIQEFASRYGVEGTPTTAVLRRGTGTFKVEGALDDVQIEKLLDIAAEANR